MAKILSPGRRPGSHRKGCRPASHFDVERIFGCFFKFGLVSTPKTSSKSTTRSRGLNFLHLLLGGGQAPSFSSLTGHSKVAPSWDWRHEQPSLASLQARTGWIFVPSRLATLLESRKVPRPRKRIGANQQTRLGSITITITSQPVGSAQAARIELRNAPFA